MRQVEVSHKSEMARPFNRGDTIINKHFTLILLFTIYPGWSIVYIKGSQVIITKNIAFLLRGHRL